MKKVNLNDICAFAARTGDTVIFVKDDEAFVIQKFDDYKEMIESREDIGVLSEEEMLAKMNREIALWRSRQQSEALDSLDDRDILDAPSSHHENSVPLQENREYSGELPMVG